MLFRNEKDVDMTSIMNDTSNQSDLAQLWSRLASDLGFNTEQDSAAALSALLDHYRREGKGSSENCISVLLEDDVSSKDVVCVVALNTATEWLSQSAERADALFQYDSFMNQVNEWTGEYQGERHLSPYVSGLQVLLRMCMNSERPAKAVLSTDTARGLAQVMANGDSSVCPGLAAAILSVCVIRCRSESVLAQTSTIVLPAISEFLSHVLSRASKTANGSGSTGVSPPGSEGTLPPRISRSAPSAGANAAALSGAEADAFYMGGALLHLILPHVSAGQSEVVEKVMLTVLGMLVRFLETPEHLEHLLPVSMALSLLGSSLKSSVKLQDAVSSKGVVGKAVDVLSSISLAKTSAPHAAQRADSVSALSINIDDPHHSEEQQLEAAVAVLRFLADLIDGAPHCVEAVMACYPGIILRSLLQHTSPGLVQATAALVARLALGNPDFQRYLRLEEVLVRLVPAMASNAEALTHKGEEHDLMARGDAIVQCCDALCALLNGSPDNHLAVSQSGSSAKVVEVLATLSSIPLNKHSVNVRLRIDDACDHLVALLSVFCRNITNRRILAAPASLDQLAVGLQRCHDSSLLPTASKESRNGSSANGIAGPTASSRESAEAGLSTVAAVEGVRAAASAVKQAMFILVSLVTVESHVARHLVELEAFMPMLFSLLDSGPECPALDNTSVLLLVLIRECKINKTMLIKVGVPAIVRMLQHHRNPSVSATAVQALSGVLTLLTMSKTMLDLVLQLGGLKLVLELLAYEAHPTDNDDDVAERVLSIHEASCVLISYLCELSSKARQQISQSEGVIDSLVSKVLLMSDEEIIHNASSAHSAIGGGAATFGTDSLMADGEAAHGMGGAESVGTAMAARAAQSQQEALVSMLGDLMKNVGPDNYVFQAAKQAMQSAQRRLPGGGDAWDGDGTLRQSATLDEKTGDLGIGGIDEEFGATGARGGGLPAIPLDTKLQLTLAAINTLFRLLHTIQDLAKLVWAVGGPALVNRIVLLASRMKDSFEEAATKILVVFFSHRHIQDAVRDAGLLEDMVGLIDSDNHTTVLIATKALAVICRNSPQNQALAVDRGLLTKCIALLHRCEDTYTAKWVILVINALVYENPKAQSAILRKDAVPLMVRWLDAGPEQEVATAAARALAKAAKGNKAVQQAICDSGGIPGFAAMLNGKPGSLAVRAAAEALADLAKENPSGQDEIREVGAIPRLLELLRTCMDSSSLVVTVVKALSVLAHSNHANMETVFRLGGVPLLLEMLSPKVGPVSNAAAADLIRVLCSNELCQQNILRNQGLQALVTTLQTTTYTAAQSATVWAMNALVQGQKATLGLLLHPDTISTLMRCITADNGAAPGTVRLLLVVFLHSGKHEELRQRLLSEPEVMVSLLDMLKKGPAVEPTKWTASLLSTLCWQENSMKDVMIKLRAPYVLAQVLEMAVSGLGAGGLASDTARTIVEATISTLQALISLIDESTPKSNEALGTQRDTTQHLQKLLKPLLRALDWLLPHYATRGTAPPREAEELLSTVLSCDDSLKSAKRHADDLRREHYTDARAR